MAQAQFKEALGRPNSDGRRSNALAAQYCSRLTCLASCTLSQSVHTCSELPGNAVEASKLPSSVSVVRLQVLVHNSQGEEDQQ